MARVTGNDLTESLAGKLGRQLVFKTYSYGTVVSRYPDMSGITLSPKQKKSNKLFREAVAYARAVLADTAKRRKYEQNLPKGKTVYNAALADYMKKHR